MNIGIRIGAASLAAIALVACGQTGSEQPETSAIAEVDDAQSASAPETSDRPNTHKQETVSDRLLGHKVYSVEEALNTEVMGLKIGMSVDEVFQTLDDRGFKVVADTAGRKLTDAQQQDQAQLKELIGDSEFDCRINNGTKCVPGSFQQAGYTWLRDAKEGQGAYEGVVARFYLDRSKEPKVYSVDYVQQYGTGQAPPNVISAMIDRFGEPTIDNSSVSPEGFESGHLNYAIQMQIPNGLKPSDNDNREGDEAVYMQHPVRAARIGCLNYQYNNITEDLPEDCKGVMDGDAEADWLYEALAQNRDSKSGTNNRFLHINMGKTQLTIELIGEMLPVAIKIEQQEAKLREMIAERKAQFDQKYQAPSDL